MKEADQFLTRILLALTCLLGQTKLQHHDDELTENDIVKANAGIQVPFGRSVFLDPVNELNIEVRPGHRCTVRVIQNDPLTQRPGQLTPVHFPCQFGPEEVRYSHYGARTPQQDKIKLLVRYDTEEDTVILPLSVHVQVSFEQLEIVNKNAPILVNRLMGISGPLDESILQFNFDPSTQTCEVTIVPKMDGPPTYGHVVNDTEPGIVKECGQFLRSDIRYRHTFHDSPNKDYIPMIVQLTDREGNFIKQEYFQVMVLIQEGQENSQPQPSFNSLLLMDVNQFVMTAITRSILAAEDAETPEDRLIFNITIPLGYSEGQIVSTDDVTVPVTSFYQKDIDDLKIAFIPPSSDSKTQRVFQVEMEVIDSDGKASDPFSLMIIVKPMNTLAPLATRNTGLMLVEGQSRKLQSSKNLQIADEDNIEDVSLSVVDGLRHGKLLMLGVPVKHFSPADLDVGVIIYQHDGTDTYTDNIIFRLDDGQHRIEFLFPISVYPSDDEPPVLNVNMGLNVRKGEDAELSSFVLSATDIDSDDSTIKFTLISPIPLDSQVLIKQTDVPEDPGNWTLSEGVYERVVTSWSQSDLNEGKLFYRFVGLHSTQTVINKLKFKVSDDHTPPNESPEQELVIKIESQDDIQPKLFLGTPLEVSVEEFQVTKLTKKHIRYTDLDTKDRFLTIRVTRRPYDTDLNNPMNPGTLVYSDRIDRVVDEFTQAEINHHKIAYRPPPVEMGIVPRIIQFDFEVIDSSDNILRDQTFRILLKPVNNKPPVILNTGFHVYENGRFNITPEVLDASDADTLHDFIIFSVADPPKHGALELRGRKLESRDIFTRNDIQNGDVTYVNGGDERNQDLLQLEVSDGIHRVPIPVNIHVSLVDDEAPKLHLNPGSYGIQLTAEEGGRVQINSKLLRASDPDTNDLMIAFIISSNPKHGVIEVDGRFAAAQFKQKDIEDGKVYYVHNGDEIGKDVAEDSFNLTVSDLSQNWVVEGTRIDQILVAVSIIPKDNVPPVVMVSNPIKVEEAGKVFLTSHDISAADIDTDDSEIVCVIDEQPHHGYLENISPLPGSEKSRAGLPITAFTISDVQNGYIAYYQGSHSGVEPVEDRLTFSCSDGVNFSPKFDLEIEIEPKNDEHPQIHLREFIVMEGMDLQIDLPILNAVDLDVPSQNLSFTVIRKPKHGLIVTQLSTGTFEISDFTLDDIAATSSNVVYHHDDSETIKDTFELELTDGLYRTRKTVIVMIIPMDDETPRLTINNGLEVTAGEVRTITNYDLKAEDFDSVDSNLTFVVRQPPRHGYLAYIEEESGTELYNLTTGFNFTQYDIDTENIKYIHTGSEGVRDLIKFDVTDGTNTLIDRYFWVQVEGIDISYPHVINRGVELPEGGKITLTTDILSTSDINSNDEHLRFTITRPPLKGHLESTDAPLVFITTFTQLDLAGNKIYYVHTSQDELKMDSFEFEVTDGYNSVYRTFRISISDVDNKKPVLYVSPMRVREGGRKLITPFELKVEDKDTPEDSLKIKIVEQPLHGQIINIELGVVNSFTMSDLTENKISYQHDGSESVRDEFAFTVTDGTHGQFFVHPNLNDQTSRPEKLTIEIYAVDNKPPHLVANKGLSSLSTILNGQMGFAFDSKVLCVKDRDSNDSNLLYIITTQPKHGIMFNSKNKQRVTNFTQGDIDDFNIYYILNPITNSTGDDFHFTVLDPGKNKLTDQVFRFNWAWISFEREIYVVNETEKYLVVTLSRRGYLGETAFVGIVINDLSAKKGQDFGSTYAEQVQFSPGQTDSKWSLRILDDSVFENGETFEVHLTEPVMAAIEEPKKIFVTIRDEEDESTVYFEKSEYVVSEDVGELIIPIHRKGDINQEMAVVCSTDSKTATGTIPSTVQSYSDYISRPESYTSMVRFARKQTIGYCRVVIIDDALHEPEEVFQIRLTLPLGGRISRNLTTITIHSDSKDAPKFYFGESEYRVEENSGYLDVNIFRSGTDLSKASSVTVRSKPSDPITAEANQDYLGIGRTLDFPPGVSRQTVKVIIVDDIGHPVLEGPESFELVLSLPVNAELAQPNVSTIVINDTLSDAPSFQFKDSKYVVHENDKLVTAYVVRHGDVKHRASIRCYTRQMTAKVDEDFEERPNNDDSLINFEPGESEKSCPVVLVDDDLYENDELFRLVLGNPRSFGAIRAAIGVRNDTNILIKDLADRPVIRLEKTKLSAKEAEINELTNVEIAIVRTGDLTKTSVVRVHTKDGSAKSGVDYVPLSKELVFGANISRLTVDVSILSDKEKEHRESFTVLLRPDKHMIAETQDSKAIIYILDLDTVSDVTFPTKPLVLSLRDYDELGFKEKTPIPGYPVICVTACNPKHPEFSKTGPICSKEGINDSLSEFRWRVAAPSSQDGVTADLYDLESATFFADTHSITLDSIYYSPGSRVQCVTRAVNLLGDPGLESESIPVTVSKQGGLCLPRIEGAFGAEPFTAKMRYTEPDDLEHPNLIKLIVIIPHQDGMLPVISTRLLSNFEFTLSPDGLRAGHHKCSNLLDYDEMHTKHSFLTNETKNLNIVGEAEPYQFNQELRGEKTLRFYRNLDLEACMWEFTSYYDTSELVNECGGSISTDGQVLNLVQSYVSLKVPLYVSYVFHSPAATGGWQHSDLHSDLRLTFVYNTAILWQQGIGTTKESQLQGNLYPTAMNIGDDGRLVVHFRTKARFTGLFVLEHEDIAVSSMVMSPEQPGLTFKLKLLHTEPTYAQPEQTWEFQSDFSVRDYTGLYYVKLIPCTVLNSLSYNEPHQCAPRDPVTFDMQIRFQQVSDPVPAEFSLDTQFHLLRQRKLWLSNGTIGFGEESDASFVPGDTIYGRIMVNPVQNLGQSFHMTVEKCFLCTGVDGYIPKYDPENKEYGCVAESKKLLYAMKIIDKGAPHTVKIDFKSIPFNASLIEEDLSDDVIALKKQPGSDGFKFQSDPLFQASYGRQWFIHCIYTVRSKENAARGIGKRSVQKHQIISTRSKRDLDLERVGNAGKGTNMHQIRLHYREISKISQDGVYEISGSFLTDIDQSLVPTLVGLALALLVILLVAFAIVRRKRRTRSRAVYASTAATTVVVRHAEKRPKVVIVASGYRANGNTEV